MKYTHELWVYIDSIFDHFDNHSLKIDQMDTITAFLQDNLAEKIFMESLEEFNDRKGKVYQLKTAIYGLKRSTRELNRKLEGKLRT